MIFIVFRWNKKLYPTLQIWVQNQVYFLQNTDNHFFSEQQKQIDNEALVEVIKVLNEKGKNNVFHHKI